MRADCEPINIQPLGDRAFRLRFRLKNCTTTEWRDVIVGAQIYDPETGLFLTEGSWCRAADSLPPGAATEIEIEGTLPPEDGAYHIYVSPRINGQWLYARGSRFLVIEAEVKEGRAHLLHAWPATLAKLRSGRRQARWLEFVQGPLQTFIRHRMLLISMVRRDLIARYRGSVAGLLWTIMQPALLIAAYFFVFGVVLRSRISPEGGPQEFALWFVAGVLPWLALSEAAGRAPLALVEHRNLVKKVVFPTEVLPAVYVFSALLTQLVGLGALLLAMALLKNFPPPSAWAWPVILVPQVLFTCGLAWFLASLGAYLRDLAQVIGLLLTLWFFLTPICYPPASLPDAFHWWLAINPLYWLVSASRDILLRGRIPDANALLWLWAVSVAVFLCGFAWFRRLQPYFADVI